MNKQRFSPLIGAMLASFSFAASAQVPGPIKPAYEIPTGDIRNNDGPRGVYIQEGIALYPSIAASVGRDVVLEPATQFDMCGKTETKKETLEVVYDEV